MLHHSVRNRCWNKVSIEAFWLNYPVRVMSLPPLKKKLIYVNSHQRANSFVNDTSLVDRLLLLFFLINTALVSCFFFVYTIFYMWIIMWSWCGRSQAKNMFNGQFGSLFRTYHNPTYFSRRLSRFADIYMASISCLLNYDLQHTFYPRRTPLQHEAPFWPEQSRTGAINTPFQNQRTGSD